MKWVYMCFFVFKVSICFGQVFDDFSDGDFTSAPQWSGDTHSFIISSEQLRLNETKAGISYLSTFSQSINDACWKFDLELGFNPSAQNFCRIYLASDSPDLSDALRGYYLQVGNSRDQVSLYRQDRDQHYLILAGPEGTTDSGNPKISIEVTRNSLGTWAVYVKSHGSGVIELLGEITDSTYLSSRFFGFYCRYTPTRSTGFAFDNIKVEGSFEEDVIPPEVQSFQVLNGQLLELELNEPIVHPLVAHFFIDGFGEPSQIISSGYNSWQLVYSGNLEHGGSYVLHMKLIDLSGNVGSISMPFHFWEVGDPKTYDIVFTEIMADPSPALQLPDEEYLEIYNTSDSSLNLKNWLLSDATSTITLPNYIIDPGSYTVICRKDKSGTFPNNISILGLSRLPSLNNTEDSIILKDSTGSMIHEVHYTDRWYRNNIKKHGGWSLEMIDVNYPCSGAQNWAASESPTGGTPGTINSITTDNPDLRPPAIVRSHALGPKRISIKFDQALAEVVHASITITPLLKIDSFFVSPSARDEVIVMLVDPLLPDVIYQVLLDGVSDCNGNIPQSNGLVAQIGLPQLPDSGDLVINEVLFNPRPLGVRFVELYNRSSKVLDLKNWKLARWQSETLTNMVNLADDHRMVYPNEIKVFASNIQALSGQHANIPLAALVEVKALPPMTDKEGSLVLLSSDGRIIDDFRYHEKMHHPLLNNLEGISLERASPDHLTNDPNNWHSGAEANGYASPGRLNSQYSRNVTSTEFKVEPKLISPRSSQLPIYTRIFFQLDEPGSTGSVYIFNQYGYRVKTLVNNSLLSTSGSFQWDGTNFNELPVPMGYYVILFQFTMLDGTTGKFMETVAVASGF